MRNLGILDYAGPAPAARQTWFVTLYRLIICVILFAILSVYLAVRTTLLVSGCIFVFIGTILLRIGGHRNARNKLHQWRLRAFDLIHLWLSDILRPIRQWRARPVQPVLLLP